MVQRSLMVASMEDGLLCVWLCRKTRTWTGSASWERGGGSCR